MNRIALGFIIVAISVLIAANQQYQAFAETQQAPLHVTANIPPIVTVMVDMLQFGDVQDAGTHDAEFDVGIECSDPATIMISFDGGLYEESDQRRVYDGATAYMPYSLYEDAARTVEMTPGFSTGYGHGGGGGYESITYYGRLTSAGDEPVGDYEDIVQVTFTY